MVKKDSIKYMHSLYWVCEVTSNVNDKSVLGPQSSELNKSSTKRSPFGILPTGVRYV